MPDRFDPYHKWLQIPPSEQPPNHYRLLGLPRFEPDAEVIENAADQRMAHLRTFQSGRYSAESQRILNEISVAKHCLLNPTKKAAYDSKMIEEQSRSHAAEDASARLSMELTSFSEPPPLPDDDNTHYESPLIRLEPRRTKSSSMIGILGAVVTALLIVIVLFRLREPSSVATEQSAEAKQKRQLANRDTETNITSPPLSPRPTQPDSKVVDVRPNSKPDAENRPQVASVVDVPEQHAEKRETPHATDSPSKSKVPAEADLKKCAEEVSISGKTAKAILLAASEADSHSFRTFYLLTAAKDQAIQEANADLAFQALDKIHENYEIDTPAETIRLLEKLKDSGTSIDLLAERAIELAQLAIQGGDRTLAKRSLNLALYFGRKSDDNELVVKATSQLLKLRNEQ